MKRVTAVLLVLLTALAVFAACSKNSVHTVTFDSSGGTQIKTQHILDGESAKSRGIRTKRASLSSSGSITARRSISTPR